MYSYITELSSNKEFSRKHVSCEHTPRKFQSQIKYKRSVSISKSIDISILRNFKYNESIDYISLNKHQIELKPINRIKIRTEESKSIKKFKTQVAIRRKSLIVENSKKLLNKLMIKLNR